MSVRKNATTTTITKSVKKMRTKIQTHAFPSRVKWMKGKHQTTVKICVCLFLLYFIYGYMFCMYVPVCIVELMNVTPHLNDIVIGLIPNSILKPSNRFSTVFYFLSALSNKFVKLYAYTRTLIERRTQTRVICTHLRLNTLRKTLFEKISECCYRERRRCTYKSRYYWTIM